MAVSQKPRKKKTNKGTNKRMSGAAQVLSITKDVQHFEKELTKELNVYKELHWKDPSNESAKQQADLLVGSIEQYVSEIRDIAINTRERVMELKEQRKNKEIDTTSFNFELINCGHDLFTRPSDLALKAAEMIDQAIRLKQGEDIKPEDYINPADLDKDVEKGDFDLHQNLEDTFQAEGDFNVTDEALIVPEEA